jgi:dTDP-4-amino-4,6-dideoxygalactose transaminase
MIPRYLPTHRLSDIVKLVFQRESFVRGAGTVFDFAEKVFPVNSASDGLAIALRALGVKGRIGLPAYTCVRVPQALAAAGCQPVFIDISRTSGTFLPDDLSRFEPGELSGVIATHMHGIPCDIHGIRKQTERLNALLIEDCALCLGSNIGGTSLGGVAPISVFSFGKAKPVNLGAGGALVVNDEDLVSTVQEFYKDLLIANRFARFFRAMQIYMKLVVSSREVWRVYFQAETTLKELLQRLRLGGPPKRDAALKSFGDRFANSEKESEIYLQLLQLLDLYRDFETRKAITKIYEEHINETLILHKLQPMSSETILPAYPLRVVERQGLYRFLRKHGVDSGLYFNYSASWICSHTRLQNSEAFSQEIITLPLHADVSAEKATDIAFLVNEWTRSREDS